MAVYLQVLEGDIPEEAEPLFATRDTRILQLVVDEFSKRIGVGHLPKPLNFFRTVRDPNPTNGSDSPEAMPGE